MTPKLGDIVEGRVVGVHAGEISIALPDGSCGSLTRDADLRPPLAPGQELWVQVIELEAGGVLRLAEVHEEAQAGFAFHEEVAQLQSSLAGSSVALPQAQQGTPRVEWRLQRWLKDTEAGLAHLAKRRGRRLSE